MKARALVYLPVLMSLGFLYACSTSKSTTVSGTGALFVTTLDRLITAYTIDLSTGKFTANGKAVATDDMPSAVVLSPKGDALFVANSTSNSITGYTVNSDGTLTGAGSTPTKSAFAITSQCASIGAGTTSTPVGLAMDSNGHLFVANLGAQGDPADPTTVHAGAISVFSVTSGTMLTEIAGSPFCTEAAGEVTSEPSALAITPNGKFLYVANEVENTVASYSVDPSSGVITELEPLTVRQPVGTSPSALIITNLTLSGAPSSNFLYVANSGPTNNISAFSICDNQSTTCLTNPPDGALTPVGSFAACCGPTTMALDPSSKFLYVVAQTNQVLEYRISGTGVLVSPSSISTGTTPVWLAVRSGSTTIKSTGGTTIYVYAANLGSDSISIFSYDSTIGGLSQVIPPVLVDCNPTCGQPSTVATK